MGRHDELLARPDSVYSRLYALQMLEPRRRLDDTEDGVGGIDSNGDTACPSVVEPIADPAVSPADPRESVER